MSTTHPTAVLEPDAFTESTGLRRAPGGMFTVAALGTLLIRRIPDRNSSGRLPTPPQSATRA
jgi:hypothetical protein